MSTSGTITSIILCMTFNIFSLIRQNVSNNFSNEMQYHEDCETWVRRRKSRENYLDEFFFLIIQHFYANDSHFFYFSLRRIRKLIIYFTETEKDTLVYIFLKMINLFSYVELGRVSSLQEVSQRVVDHSIHKKLET